MKLISWNVNGLRACIQKGFLEEFARLDADFFCLQETKLQEGQLQLDLPGYYQYWCYAEKKGYSGTAIFTKYQPLNVTYGIGVPELDTEGRVITLTYPEFYLVTCYTPNAQQGLARLEHRLKWEDAFRAYLITLDAKKPVILCGDLNVAHQEIDLKNPAANRGSAGFSDQERSAFGKLLDSGFTDTFRYLNPTATGAYSWWSYRFNARQNNAGWRIDYFLVSNRLQEALYKAPIYSDILGSDHCPVGLELDITCNGSIWLEKAEGTPRVVAVEATKAPKKSTKALQAGIAAGLLAIGFAMGHFLPPLFSPDPTEPNITLSTSPNPGIMTDYASMSTQELVNLAIAIPELAHFGSAVSSTILVETVYAKLAEKNPVLYELERRPDLKEHLSRATMIDSGRLPSDAQMATIQAASCLLGYYTRIGLFDSNNNGIAIDYAAMSTTRLVGIVITIDELGSRTTELNLEDYESLRSRFPVLLELERRSDLEKYLRQAMNDALNSTGASSALPKKYVAASILYSYYTNIGIIGVDSVTPDLDYAELSTQELVEVVVSESDMFSFSNVTSAYKEATYQSYLSRFPALKELDQRADKTECLIAYINSPTEDKPQEKALAQALLSYYMLSFSVGENRWVYSTTENYTIYEYTYAPVYGYSEITKPGDTAPMQTMSFEGEPLILARAPEWIRESNFWVRIETQDTYLYQSPELKINGRSPEQYEDEMLLHIIPYYDTYGTMRGLMVFGNVQKQYHLHLEYPNGSVLAFTATPTPPENATTREMMEYTFKETNLFEYLWNTNGQDVSTYRPMKLLLEREDFFPTLVSILYDGKVLGKGTEQDSIYFDCDILIGQDSIRDKCPKDILKAYQMIVNQDYLLHSVLIAPSVKLLSPNIAISQYDYLIPSVPDSLSEIPQEEWNFHTVVRLKNDTAAENLPMDQWHLEVITPEDFQGVIGITPYFTYNSGSDHPRWIITGKIPEDMEVEVRLCHGEAVLQTVYTTLDADPEIIYG